MNVLIAINGMPTERSLISARKQKCDLVVINDKKEDVDANLLVIDNKDLFFKSALKYAEKYDFVYLMDNNTVLFRNCVNKILHKIGEYDGVYTDNVLCGLDNVSVGKRCTTYYTSIVHKKVDTGPNHLIRIAKVAPSSLDDFLFSGKYNIQHLAEVTYFMGK
jgi:hypothetical protein